MGVTILKPNDSEVGGSYVKKLECSLGFRFKDLSSMERLAQLFYRPKDPASLGVFRMLFGFAMIHDIMNERHMGNLIPLWGEPVYCHFPLFDFIQPVSLAWMHIVYLIMLIGAICIAFGIVFRFTIWLFAIPYWYLFLLDKTRWNNHSYLYGLISILLAFTRAENFMSLDTVMFPEKLDIHVPLWNYTVLRFQVFLVYFYAGLKKLEPDWVMGWSMSNLSRHWVFSPFTMLMSSELVDHLVVHGGGLCLDLFGGWLLLFDKTRPFAMVFITQFHVMNSQLFEIGMFPYVMLTTSLVFCHPCWPRKLFLTLQNLFSLQRDNSTVVDSPNNSPADSNSKSSPEADPCIPSISCLYKKEDIKPEEPSPQGNHHHINLHSKPTLRHKTVSTLVIVYVFLQCFLPYSHFITKGYNLWTEGLYGYSWDMMIQSWSMQHIRVRFVNLDSGETGYLNPEAMTQGMGRRWSSHPDMVKQYGACVDKKFREMGINNFTLHIDVWRSMNNRFQQRMINPRVDILTAEWSPFKAPSWTMPLLSELSNWRQRLGEIKSEFRKKSDQEEELIPHIVFAADFPGLYLENFVQRDVDGAYLELLEGELVVEFLGSDDAKNQSDIEIKNVSLSHPRTRIQVPSGEFHRVHTVGDDPSCYMYIFVNSTDAEVWRNLSRLRKTIEKMENVTKHDKLKWNFTDPLQIAEFNQLSEDNPEVEFLHLRWFRKMEQREFESKSAPMRFLRTLHHTIYEQWMKYMRSLERAGKAVISIANGMRMEEYLSYERLHHERESMADRTKSQLHDGVGSMDDDMDDVIHDDKADVSDSVGDQISASAEDMDKDY